MDTPLFKNQKKNPTIQAVLSLITAVIVGVIVNLVFYLGEGILFFGKIICSLSFNPVAFGWILFSLLSLIKYDIAYIDQFEIWRVMF